MRTFFLLLLILSPLIVIAQTDDLKIEITVVDTDGNPLPNMEVYHYILYPIMPGNPTRSFKKTAYTDSNGIARMKVWNSKTMTFGAVKSPRNIITFNPAADIDIDKVVKFKIVCNRFKKD